VACKYIGFKIGILLSAALYLAAPFDNVYGSPAPQGISARVPVVGFVFDDQARTLRAILGSPGAAMLSGPWDLGSSFKQVRVALGHRFGVAITDNSGVPVIVRLDQRPVPLESIPNVLSDADSVVLSPSGTVAAIYYKDAGAVEVLGGLPNRPAFIALLPLNPGSQAPRRGYRPRLTTNSTTSHPAGLRAFAVSDDASTILASVEDQSGTDSVVLMSMDGSWRYIFSTSGPSQITFLFRSNDSVIVDQGTGDVYLFKDPSASAQLTRLPGIRETIGTAVGAGLSYSNKYVFFTSKSTGMTARMELATGVVSAASCNCSPEGLSPLDDDSLFRLNGMSGAGISIYSGAGNDPQTFVVPVSRELEAGMGLPLDHAPGANLQGPLQFSPGLNGRSDSGKSTLLNRLVGEIHDDTDGNAEKIVEERKGVFVVSGSLEPEALEERLGAPLVVNTDCTTVACAVVELFGRLPSPGEKIEHGGVEIEVLDANPRRVQRLRLKTVAPKANE
jgi:hypothetical protein